MQADVYGLARHRDGRWEWAAAPVVAPTPRYQACPLCSRVAGLDCEADNARAPTTARGSLRGRPPARQWWCPGWRQDGARVVLCFVRTKTPHGFDTATLCRSRTSTPALSWTQRPVREGVWCSTTRELAHSLTPFVTGRSMDNLWGFGHHGCARRVSHSVGCATACCALATYKLFFAGRGAATQSPPLGPACSCMAVCAAVRHSLALITVRRCSSETTDIVLRAPQERCWTTSSLRRTPARTRAWQETRWSRCPPWWTSMRRGGRRVALECVPNLHSFTG